MRGGISYLTSPDPGKPHPSKLLGLGTSVMNIITLNLDPEPEFSTSLDSDYVIILKENFLKNIREKQLQYLFQKYLFLNIRK